MDKRNAFSIGCGDAYTLGVEGFYRGDLTADILRLDAGLKEKGCSVKFGPVVHVDLRLPFNSFVTKGYIHQMPSGSAYGIELYQSDGSDPTTNDLAWAGLFGFGGRCYDLLETVVEQLGIEVNPPSERLKQGVSHLHNKQTMPQVRACKLYPNVMQRLSREKRVPLTVFRALNIMGKMNFEIEELEELVKRKF